MTRRLRRLCRTELPVCTIELARYVIGKTAAQDFPVTVVECGAGPLQFFLVFALTDSGRTPIGDAIDAFMAFFTNWQMTEDKGGAHGDLLAEFPSLELQHNA